MACFEDSDSATYGIGMEMAGMNSGLRQRRRPSVENLFSQCSVVLYRSAASLPHPLAHISALKQLNRLKQPCNPSTVSKVVCTIRSALLPLLLPLLLQSSQRLPILFMVPCCVIESCLRLRLSLSATLWRAKGDKMIMERTCYSMMIMMLIVD
jgi:hypothetical protein